MKGLAKYVAIIGCSGFVVALSQAQQANVGSLGGIPVITGEEGTPPDWQAECTDPTNTDPISDPYIVNSVANELMLCSMGGGGTWTAGGSHDGTGTPPIISPCFSPNTGAQTTQNQGKFAFSYGSWEGGLSFSPNAAISPLGIGSIQQYSPGFHNANMAINFGAPFFPSYSYANFVIDGTQEFFGGNVTLFYEGESNRYMTFEDDGVGPFNITLQVELVADAVRFRWTCDNVDAAAHNIALWFCSGLNMLDDQSSRYWQAGSYVQGDFGQGWLNNAGTPGQFYDGPDSASEPDFFNDVTNPNLLPGEPPARFFREYVPLEAVAPGPPTGYEGIFIYLPNQRPPDTDTDLNEATDPIYFPTYADFVFGETDSFGIRIETQPSSSTNDTNPTNVPSTATELTLGKAPFIIGSVTATGPLMTPTVLIPDTGFLVDPAFVIKYQSILVQPAETYQFLNYVRSTWGSANYALPFGAVVDAPAVVQEGSTNYDGTNTLGFNPTGGFPGGHLIDNVTATQEEQKDGLGTNQTQLIRVWIDNVGGNVSSGYGIRGKEFTLDDVQVNIQFPSVIATVPPTYNPNVRVINPGGASQTINSIAPRTDAYVDFFVQFSQNTVGQIPYTVTINTVPLNTKVISGTIQISGRPQLELYPGPNLVAAPYVFTDSSWLSILSDFTPSGPNPGLNVTGSANFETYIFDPSTGGYEPSTQAARGLPVWVVYNNTKPVFAQMEGTPTTPFGFDNSTQQIELKPGWNLIANPYDLEFAISQVNGVAAAAPDVPYTYNELVDLGYISGYVASWDPTQSPPTYDYVSGNTGVLEPNTGYWIDDLLSSDITLSYPPLYSEGSPGSPNRAPAPPLGAGLWRMSLKAAEGAASDVATVGTAGSARLVKEQTIYEAPASPTQSLMVGMYGSVAGKTVDLKQAVSVAGSSYTWSGFVDTLKAGSITLTWPTVTSVPSQFDAFLIDQSSGAVIDMRAQSSYSFAQIVSGLRRFTVVVKPVSKVTTLITAVTAAPQKVGAATEEKISYTLTQAATTTTTIKNATTQAVVDVVHLDRADPKGVSVDLWNLKNTLGQTVAAGKYIVQVSAVTSTGAEQTYSITTTVP